MESAAATVQLQPLGPGHEATTQTAPLLAAPSCRAIAARGGIDAQLIASQIEARLAARKAKNWAEADRIRDELSAMGIALMDAKDPATGEIVTTWQVAR